MSRTGLYWTDDRDRLNCAHGVILHGTGCVQCERGDLPEPRSFMADAVRAGMAGKFHDGGFIPKSLHATGFDHGRPGGDKTAFVRGQRVGDTMRFTVDDLKSEYVISKAAEDVRRAMNGDRAHMAAMEARMSAANKSLRDELLREAAQGRGWGGPYDTNKRWEHSRGDARARWGHWPGSPYRNQVEIITDPLDQRGVNARRVGPAL